MGDQDVMDKLDRIEGRLGESLDEIKARMGKLEGTTEKIGEDVASIKTENAVQAQELRQHCDKIKTLESRSWAFGGLTTVLSSLAILFGLKT